VINIRDSAIAVFFIICIPFYQSPAITVFFSKRSGKTIIPGLVTEVLLCQSRAALRIASRDSDWLGDKWEYLFRTSGDDFG
jgi:hypothetical protein